MTTVDRAKYMDLNEIKQLQDHAKAMAFIDLKKGRVRGPLAWMVVDMALSTGLRVSEMVALQIKDINFKRGWLTITRVKRKKKAPETLPISKKLVEHLKEYIGGCKNGSLFIGGRGPLTVQGLQQKWKQAVRLSGLPKGLSIHSARHTIAVQLLKKTGNLRRVQKQLGHASPVTTANMYADISFEDMQDDLNVLYE